MKIQRFFQAVAAIMVLQVAAPVPTTAQETARMESGGFEIRIAPKDFIIANEARVVGLGYDGTSPYYDLVLQTIFFVNRSNARLTLEECSIELLAKGVVLQKTAIAREEIRRCQQTAVALTAMKFQPALQILYSAGTTLPEGVTIAQDLTLAKDTAALVDDCYLIVRSAPDEVRVTARARTEAGRDVTAVAALPVREYESKNSYVFPLEAGEWFVLAFPGLHGHHRWTASTEHAIDITMVDSRGSWARGGVADFRQGSVPRWEDWYAYNKKVLAAADGVVVKVVDTVEFPLSFWNRRQGESFDEYQGRIGKKQMELFMVPGADPVAVAGGNYVVIKHAGEEYSSYMHLAHGSIRVKEGQRVARGEHIAGVGGTGESPQVHLHFQVSDSPSLSATRTFPVRFTNVEVNEPHVDAFAPKVVFQPGFFVKAAQIGGQAAPATPDR